MRYLDGCPDSFVRSADVMFVVDSNRLPVHSQFLSRYCCFFADMFDTLGQAPSREEPLILKDPFDSVQLPHILLFLDCIYHPGDVDSLVGSADLCTRESLAGVYELADKFEVPLLKAALDKRVESADIQELLEEDPQGWLELADRFHLIPLRCSCVDLLLRHLADAGTGKQLLRDLDWGRADKQLVLQLLEGVLTSVYQLSAPDASQRNSVYYSHPRLSAAEVVARLPKAQSWAGWERVGDAMWAPSTAGGPT